MGSRVAALSPPEDAHAPSHRFQFGAFSPLFRLHGHRDGGPPADECGGTNGDNEVWNLAQDPAHYDAIVAVMRLREGLRQYVSDANAVTAATGMPMARPMFLAWPLDAGCAGADVEDQVRGRGRGGVLGGTGGGGSGALGVRGAAGGVHAR